MLSIFSSHSKKIFFYFIILLLLGSIFVYSSSAFLGQYHYLNSFYFYKKQILGIILSLFIVHIISYIPITILKKYSQLLFAGSLLINILTIIPLFKFSVNGASRWIKFYSLTFQPSEILKPFYLLYISTIFSNYYDQIKHILFYLFTAISISIILLIMQSDFGSIILLSAITFILLWRFLYQKKILIYLFIISLLFFIVLILSKPYRILRILTYLNPWQDPSGNGFQIIQSLIGIQNGGYLGSGIGCSKQSKLFLPMAHTDFIFSIICEEIGISGGAILIILLLYFSGIFIYLAEKMNIISHKYFFLGVGMIISFQTIINISGTTMLLPAKGIGLPTISYGISSIIGLAILIGISLSILKEKNN